MWDVLADASGETLSERIAKAESLGIAWAPVMALLTLESDRRLRARRAACALLGTGATMPFCPCLICSRARCRARVSCSER